MITALIYFLLSKGMELNKTVTFIDFGAVIFSFGIGITQDIALVQFLLK